MLITFVIIYDALLWAILIHLDEISTNFKFLVMQKYNVSFLSCGNKVIFKAARLEK